jgi:nucleoporin NUP82
VFELNNAVAELFRKCEALRSELQEQIAKANEVKQRIDTISGNESGDDEPVSEDMLIKDRLRQAKHRQEDLARRMENIRRKVGRATSRELSDKEKAWMDEVRALGDTVLEADEERSSSSGPRSKQVWKRFEEIHALKDALLLQAEQLQKKSGDVKDVERASSPALGLKIPADVRKAKVAQVMSMLERESALVDAVKSRLERLSVGQ